MNGQTISHYRILAKLGEGAMGVVYRAEDAKLRRNVALKFLPDADGNAAMRDRFLREAQAAAALNHPNICTIFEIDEDRGFLAMELVEGPSLKDKIAERPLKLDEALDFASQIAAGLQAAHDKGVTHRDIKPANILLTGQGQVKITDFGLAALADRSRITKTGSSMGTPAYMSPEQAKGEPLDRRTDLWSLGVVLYEMLTGRLPFAGDTEQAVSYGIVNTEPEPPTALRSRLPVEIDRVTAKALAKNPGERYQHAADLQVDLRRLPKAQPARRRSLFDNVDRLPEPRLGWVVAACLLLALAAVSLIHFRETPPEQPVLTTSFLPPDKASFQETAISPDGKLLAFTAATEGKRQLWVRPLHSLAAQPLTGTEQAAYPFWSPDSRWIGFFAQGKLKKIEASGGPAQTLCDAATARGGTWNQDGVIVYGAVNTGLWRVAAQGGTPTQLTVPDRAKGNIEYRWPVFLPGGRRYVYTDFGTENTAGIYLGALDSKEHTKLVGDRSSPGYAEGPAGEGYLLFVRETMLMAQRFDAGKGALTGESFPVAEKVGMVDYRGRAEFSVSGNGMLVYGAGWGGQTRLTWMDRGGKRLETIGDQSDGLYPALSPDGKQVAFRMAAAQGQVADIWVRDLARGIPTRFTFHPSNHSNPIWSPDGSRIVFASLREGHANLYLKSASGAGQEERLLKAGNAQLGSDWTAAGDLLLYYENDPKTKNDLWVLPMTGERKPAVFLKTEFNEGGGVFSPDGKWIAYSSDESGRYEIYVQPYPATGAKWQVSRDGGARPKWRRDGREIYWLKEDGTLMAAEVSMGQTFQPGNVAALFETGITNLSEHFAVTADGKRFLVPAPVEETEGARPVTVVQNWLAGARR